MAHHEKKGNGAPKPSKWHLQQSVEGSQSPEPRDPLAAVDGFRVLTHLMLEHLFGVRCCPICPDCNVFAHEEPCQDKCGSNAEPSGDIFGRVDAVYVTLEAQKSTGSMHGHAQVFVQCLHQHTPLEEIFRWRDENMQPLRRAYENYHAHVGQASYAGQDKDDIQKRLDAVEASWPEHDHDTVMTAPTGYQLQRARGSDADAEAGTWKQAYLEEDVVALQLLKQHHYPTIPCRLVSHCQDVKRVTAQECARVNSRADSGFAVTQPCCAHAN